MSLDVLAFGPHPDDVEIFCGGTVAKLVLLGYTVGLVDLTRGEMGTRGSREDRDREADEASEILGITVRERLDLPDGYLNSSDFDQRHKVIEVIRKHQPRLVIAPTAEDRHPDHLQGSTLVENAVFLANVGKYPSELERHKVPALLRYPMWWNPQADLIVDVSETWEQRMKAVAAYKSQFHNPHLKQPATYLASETFFEWVDGRGALYGAQIGVRRGEPFVLRNPIPVDDPIKVLVEGKGTANP
jgi:bacillithiol biosynthesis deacetylase BshB1